MTLNKGYDMNFDVLLKSSVSDGANYCQIKKHS